MRPNFRLIILCLLCIVAGIALVWGGRYLYFKFKPTPTFEAQATDFRLQPPSQALKGRLQPLTSGVSMIPRGETDPQPASTAAEVAEGDAILTAAAAATIEFPTLGSLELGPNSRVSVANGLPGNFLIRQTTGRVEYAVTNPQTLSVRTLNVLVWLKRGTAIMTTNDTSQRIEIVTGPDSELQLGLIDTENNTHTWNLSNGQRASVNSQARTVEIDS